MAAQRADFLPGGEIPQHNRAVRVRAGGRDISVRMQGKPDAAFGGRPIGNQQRLRHPAFRDVPHRERVVAAPACRKQPLAVRRETYAPHLVRMTGENRHVAPVRDAPQPDRMIAAAGRQQAAVRAERHAQHRVRMAGKYGGFFAVRRIPKPRRAIVAAGREPAPVRAERRAPRGSAMSALPPNFARRRRVPQRDGAVLRSYSEKRAGRMKADGVDAAAADRIMRRFQARDFPQPDRAIPAAGREPRAVRRKRDG